MLLALHCAAPFGLGTEAPAQIPAKPAAEAATEPDAGLVELEATILLTGAAGTEQARREHAVLAPGRAGLLRTEVELPGGGLPVAERVSLEIRVRLEPAAVVAREPEAGKPAPLRLSVDATARAAPSGEVVMRSGGGEVTLPGSILFDAYVSRATSQRVVLHLSARAWTREPAAVPRATIPEPRPVAYRLWVYRKTPAGLDLVEAPVLGSLVGRPASYSFGFVVDGPDGSPVRESLEFEILGVDLRDGVLTGTASLAGTLRGRPVRAAVPWALRSGEQAFLSLTLPAGEGPDLGFELAVVPAF